MWKVYSSYSTSKTSTGISDKYETGLDGGLQSVLQISSSFSQANEFQLRCQLIWAGITWDWLSPQGVINVR